MHQNVTQILANNYSVIPISGRWKVMHSTILCNEAAHAGFLGASFFFWRGSPDRNNAKKLFTTVAYQLAMLNDVLAGYILAEIQLNPLLIHDASINFQFQKLISSLASNLSGPVKNPLCTIIIDGLDECEDKAVQLSILRLLVEAVQYEGFPLGFFITSRPELHLQEVWDTEEIASVTKLISLSNIPGSQQDIQTVLQSGFSLI
ncbi:hypothetical protein BDQ17DRAFT_521726 [Cyathus striatus]|nr:hypothetical protein BDQ17DRAFT_521726 [Cyathus striatus]